MPAFALMTLFAAASLRAQPLRFIRLFHYAGHAAAMPYATGNNIMNGHTEAIPTHRQDDVASIRLMPRCRFGFAALRLT